MIRKLVRTLKTHWAGIGAGAGITIVLGAVAYLIIFHGHLDTATHSNVEKVMIFGLALYASFLLFSRFLQEHGQSEQQKPRIRVWTLDDLTIAVAAIDAEIGLQARERIYLALLPGRERRIVPLLYALFSDKPAHQSKWFNILPMEIYHSLESRCVVERTEMQIPNRQDALPLDAFWRLVTNRSDAVFPAEPAIKPAIT